MENKELELYKLAKELGFSSSKKQLFELKEWLREEHRLHVEVGSIWDELTNYVESYCYTITAPINLYYFEPVYASGGKSYREMLLKGLEEALFILKSYNKQKNIRISDDQVVICYLKGYGDKEKHVPVPAYRTNIERYAYLQGKQGDYIEEGLTEDDIVLLVRNIKPEEENLRLEKGS